MAGRANSRILQGKAEDIGAAVLALTKDRQIGAFPIFALGVCAGGGYMALAVANGLPIRAFAGVAGVYPSAAQTRGWLGAGYDAAIDRARAAERRWRTTGEAETIPAVSADNGGVAMPLAEAYEYYGTRRGAVPNYVNGFAVQSRAYTLPFDVQELASSLHRPTIMIHSENALMPALAKSFSRHCQEKRRRSGRSRRDRSISTTIIASSIPPRIISPGFLRRRVLSTSRTMVAHA